MIRTLLSAFLLVLLSFGVCAKGKFNDPYKDYDESTFMDMDFKQNILTPEVGPDEHGAIKKYMTRLGDNLAKKGYIVDLERKDEVVIVTIPTDDLFLPNDTLLISSGLKKITPILTLLADPEMFKLVYTVNTDNTGSHDYNMWLSHQRNNSIYDWLLNQVSEDLIIIPFEMGDSAPVEDNHTRIGRAANRRVEFHLIPGPKMITQAHKGLLR